MAQRVSSLDINAATATLSSVASSATAVQLLAANLIRRGVYIFNESNQILYLGFTSSVSLTNYTTQIGPNAFYEIPTQPVYTGVIQGIWAAANGSARITELK